MTLSSESRAMNASGRTARVIRGRAVENALPAALNVEYVEGESPRPRRHQSPTERVEAARQEAYDEGFHAGLAAARGGAEDLRSEAVQRAAAALTQAAAAIEAGRSNAISVVEEDATNLAVELTRTLMDHELSLADSAAASAIRRALRLTAPGEDLVIRLHPDEVIEATELQAYVTDCRITVVPDESVQRAGCVIDAGPCRIDAQIESALGRVRWALLAASGTRSADGSDVTEPPPTMQVLERARGRS